MKINEVKTIIEKTVKRKGYALEERKSVKTDSWYFTIKSGSYSLMFRVADHGTRSNVITLRLDRKSTTQSVEGFVSNRCKDLGVRAVKGILGV